VVVGGGIGGLATAIALRNAGIDAAVFERAENVQTIQVGAGVALWANAVRALSLLGLHEAAEGVSSRLEYLSPRTWDGKTVAKWPVGDIARDHGFPPIAISRPDLHQVLLNAVDPGVLHLGSHVTRFEQDDGGVTIHLADGSTERGDVLIGADGGRSVVRAQLHGPEEPRYSGQT
jgi:2-polyprenyl-6-methoxyphenol hydroxylase-like FAD-dependent oxidoreductase